jgi:peptide/nickel transport system permease protein
LLLALAAMFRPGDWTLAALLAATSWMTISRIVRAQLKSCARTSFVEASRAAGSSELQILLHHLLPRALPAALVATTLQIGELMLLEASLSFLGLGVQPPLPSWGAMLAESLADLGSAWWTGLFPGSALVLTVFLVQWWSDRVLAAETDPPRAHRSPPNHSPLTCYPSLRVGPAPCVRMISTTSCQPSSSPNPRGLGDSADSSSCTRPES